MNRIIALVFGICLAFGLPLQAQTWSSSDVGAVGLAGSDSYNSGTGVYTLQGSGANIGGTADAFHFVYQTISGDGEFTARVVSIQNTNAAAQAGVMVRQNLDPGSIEAMTAQTVSNGVSFLQRTTLAGNTAKPTTPNGGAPYWVKIVKDGDLVTSYQSANGTSWTLMGVTQLTFTGPVDIGLAVSSHVKTKLCTATFDNINFVTQPSYPPPAPWVDQDIGATGLNGGVHFENNLWTVYACGANIGSTSDAFHYVYQPLFGDGTIIAQVDSLTNTSAATKAGVMIRQDLTPGAANALVAVSSSQGISFQYRTSAGGTTSTVAGANVSAPYWVKLVRSGNQLYAYQSADGASWQQFGVVTINMTGQVYIGLAETSHNNNNLAVGVISDVQVGPAALQVNTQTDTSVDLIWPSLADPSLVAQYEIDRNGTAVGYDTETNFEDLQLTPATTYSYVVKALNSSNSVLATTPALSVTTDSAWLPSPWSHLDIGDVDLAGGTQFDNTTGIYTMTGSGAGISAKADAFQFAEQPLTGDGQIIARVTAISATNGGTKAGIMMRETNAAGSRHASMLVTYGNVLSFLRRSATNGGSSTTAGGKVQFPIWLKLIRQGNIVTSYQSGDGLNWSTLGSDTVAMSAAINVGLALTSNDVTALANATIDNVTTVPGNPVVTQPPSAPGTPTQVAVGDASASLKWTAATDAVGVMGYQVLRNGQVLNTTAMLQYTDVGLSPGQSYIYTIKAINVGGLLSVPSTGLTVNTQANAVPSPWVHQEIGAVALAGMASGTANAFSISASGNDIGGNADAFGFVYQPLTSDGQITVRVTAIQNTNAWAKAGVMLRQSLDPGSPYAFMLASASKGLALETRSVANGNSPLHKGSVTGAPVWVRVVRQGSVLSGYSSVDGVNWTLVSQQTIPMNLTIYAGLAVTSHKNGTLATATFDQVSFVQANVDSDGNGLPDWWENLYFGQIGNNPNSSPDGNGFTLLQDYQGGADPTNYYSRPGSNGPILITPVIAISGGNNQSSRPGMFAPQPLTVNVTNGSGGALLANAPVTFTVAQGGGLIAATSGGTTGTSLLIRTDGSGNAQVYYQQPTNSNITSQISAATGVQSVSFTEVSNGAAATPTVTPSPGQYLSAQTVTLSSSTPGATIYYTTNGNTPTTSSSSVASGGTILVGQSETLKAMAVATGYANSAILTAAYQIVPVISSLAGGSDHTLIVKSGGTVEAWGRNQFGQLGLPVGADVLTSTVVPGVTQAKAVATGSSHTLILNQDGTVLACGDNYFGQLGDGTNTDNSTPHLVPNLSSVVAVAAGDGFSVALKSDGTVWAWGSDAKGQLGQGNQVDQSSPIQISSLAGIKAIATGRNFAVALNSNGTLLAWGSNSSGQIGDGTTTDRWTPVAVSGLSQIASISCGANHALAVDASGNLWAWGANAFGQAGNATLAMQLLAQQVPGISGAQTASGGWNHSAVLTANHIVWTFGANDDGQLGNGTLTDSPTPVQVSNLPAGLISTGSDHAAALKIDGTLWTWGQNAHGQLGNGTTTGTAAPAQTTY